MRIVPLLIGDGVNAMIEFYVLKRFIGLFSNYTQVKAVRASQVPISQTDSLV